MQPVSATDAIGLAFTHTRTVLAASQFRLGRFFKLALLAAVTQASFLSSSFTYPLQGGQIAARTHARHASEQLFVGDGIGGLAGGVGLGLVLLVLTLLVMFTLAYVYLLCRARATLFDLVVFRGARVREAWRRRGRPSRIYWGLYLAAMVVFLAVVAAVLGPFLVRFAKLAAAGGLANPSTATSLLLSLVGLIWLLMPVWIAVDALLQDFILPGLVLGQAGLDDAPVSAAFGRLGAVARRRPGQLLLFLVLRTILPLGVGVALGTVVLVGIGLVVLAGYGVGRLLYSALWSGGLAAHTFFFAALAAMVMVVVALYLLAVTAVYGVTGVFKTSYAAFFYAGDYPELAAALAGQAAPTPQPQPPGLW
jgi:hypothetical protein